MAVKQDTGFIILAVLTMVAFLAVQIVCGIIMSQAGDICANHSLQYATDISPPPWAFSIWFLIYLWQFAWIIYVLTTICRQSNGKPIYQVLNVISKPFLVAYIINQLLSVVFFFIFLYITDDNLIPMLGVFSLWATVLICLVQYHIKMAAVPTKVAIHLREDITCLIVLVQNGLAIYLSWLTIADMLVLNSYAVYTVGADMAISSLMVMTLLTVIVTLYFFLDLTYWKDYTKYTFSTYPTLMWGLMSITIDKWDPNSPTAICVLVLLLVVTLLFVAKIAVTVVSSKINRSVTTYMRWKNVEDI